MGYRLARSQGRALFVHERLLHPPTPSQPEQTNCNTQTNPSSTASQITRCYLGINIIWLKEVCEFLPSLLYTINSFVHTNSCIKLVCSANFYYNTSKMTLTNNP